MTEKEMKLLTKNNAIAIAKICLDLPITKVNQIYINQILRCSSSVASNYRAACRGKSARDFIHKLQIVEEEADETMFFLELLMEFNPNYKVQLQGLYVQTEEILKIIVASIKTIQKNQNSKIENQK
jgi:four helix bundle protein